MDSKYYIGRDIIDAQHKELFAILDALEALGGKTLASKDMDRDTVSYNDERMELSNLMIQLVDYTAYHFKEEEAEMFQLGYDDLDKHKEKHKLFVAKLKSISVYDMVKDHQLITETLVHFVRNWLQFHILNEDKQVFASLI